MDKRPQTPSSSSSSPEQGHPKNPTRAKLALGAITALVVAGLILFFIFSKGDGASKASQDGLDQDETTARAAVGDFELTKADGKTDKFSEFKGEVVILSFWASWCQPCLVELPEFTKLAEKLGNRGLRIIPVNVDEADAGRKFTREFWDKNDLDLPAYFDSTRALAGKFSVDTLPANFVIDRAGRVAFSSFGAMDWTDDAVIAVLDDLLAEPQTRP